MNSFSVLTNLLFIIIYYTLLFIYLLFITIYLLLLLFCRYDFLSLLYVCLFAFLCSRAVSVIGLTAFVPAH